MRSTCQLKWKKWYVLNRKRVISELTLQFGIFFLMKIMQKVFCYCSSTESLEDNKRISWSIYLPNFHNNCIRETDKMMWTFHLEKVNLHWKRNMIYHDIVLFFCVLVCILALCLNLKLLPFYSDRSTRFGWNSPQEWLGISHTFCISYSKYFIEPENLGLLGIIRGHFCSVKSFSRTK